MADQPVTRLLARHSTGGEDDMIAAVLQCGCVVTADVDGRRIDRRARSVAGTMPCPVGHPAPETPAVARCADCGVELGGEVRECDSRDGNLGFVGDPPCGHLAGALQQLRLDYGSFPWRRTPGWYCMGCSFPPR